MRVLVVDDDLMLRSAVATALVGTAEVVEAADGPSALALLDQTAVDLVLLEVVLPGMGGFELLARLRRGRHADLPAVMLTARTGEADRVTAYRTGADGHVTKPYAPAVLCQVVRTVAAATPGQRQATREAELGRAVLLRQIEQHFGH